MKITLVGSGAGIGGTERHLASLVRRLPECGFDIDLITSVEGPLTNLARTCGAGVTVVPRESGPTYLRHLISHFRRSRPAVVHTHTGRIPCLAARIAGVGRILDTRHGHSCLDPAAAGDGRWIGEGLKGRLAHLTLAVCEADAEVLIRRGRLPRERVRVVYNGLPDRGERAGEERPGHDRALLGWVGRMAEVKAPSRLLAVLSGIVDHGGLEAALSRPVRLQLIGDGPLREALAAEAIRLGIADRVEFVGAVADPLPWIERFGLLLLPSRTEGMPYVLLEALSVGTPALATPVGGVGEVLTGALGDGLVPWLEELWVNSATTLLGSEARWNEAHVAALSRMEAFREDQMVERIAAIYQEGLGD